MIFCAESTEKLTNDWSEISCLVFNSNPMVLGDSLIFSIGYNYNPQKVILLIATEGAGTTKSVILYLSDYPDHFTNISIQPVFIHLSCLSS